MVWGLEKNDMACDYLNILYIRKELDQAVTTSFSKGKDLYQNSQLKASQRL